MKFRRASGELIVPVLAVTYALYAWWEQMDGVYRADTILYMSVLIVSVIVLSLAVIAGSLYAAWRNGRVRGREPGDADANPNESRHFFRPVLLACSAAGLVFSINWLGYLAAFTLFVVVMLIAMGARSGPRILIITVCTVLVLHMLFIELLDQQLPRGLLSTLMKLS